MITKSLSSLGGYLASTFPKANTPLAFVYCVDNKLIKETVEHLQNLEFSAIVLFGQSNIQATLEELEGENGDLIFVNLELENPSRFFETVFGCVKGLLGRWIYWSYNAEFLFFPFFETRTIKDFTTFLVEEKRGSSFAMLIDAYSMTPRDDPYDIDLEDLGFDAINYYKAPTTAPDFLEAPEEVAERLVDIRGGLRWRLFEELPETARSLSRSPLIHLKGAYELNEYGRLDTPEIYTHRSLHHASPTCAVVSLRLTLDLLHNPKTRKRAKSLQWEGSEHLSWSSPQLLRHGIIETGQWF